MTPYNIQEKPWPIVVRSCGNSNCRICKAEAQAAKAVYEREHPGVRLGEIILVPPW